MATNNSHLSSTKLISIVRLLSNDEFKSFGKWLQSPWCNSNKKLVELYKLIQKQYPEFSSKTLTKERLFSRLYPGKKYDDKWMRNIMGAMSKQVEKFLRHQRLEKDEILSDKLLAEEFLERHKNDWFNKQTETLINKIELKETKETEDYLLLAQVHEDLYRHTTSAKINPNKQSPLQISNLYLDTFYSISKWRIFTEMLERNMILQEDIELDKKLASLSSITRHLDIPVINIYKQRINIGEAPILDNYYLLKNHFLSEFERVPKWDQKLLIFYLINTAIRLWIKGEDKLVNELFELYKFGLERQLLFHYGRLTGSTFRNIVATANILGHFEFSYSFINNYNNALPPGIRKDLETWAIGHCLHKQNKLVEAIDLLSAYEFKTDDNAIIGKVLILECYFDASLIDGTYVDLFFDFSNAFMKYIKRNRIYSDNRKMAYYNMIKYTQKLCNIFHFSIEKAKDIKLLKSAVNNDQNLQSRQWLKNKIAEMEQGAI